jgi:hypothetical protein
MKKEIREILSKYRQNEGYTMEHAERELLNLFSVSGSAFDIEELHTLHSGLITAKPHLNKRTKGYMMVVAMIEKLSYLIREHYR